MYDSNPKPGQRTGSPVPAIWLYPQHPIDVEVSLTFHGAGFMTSSTPNYLDKWRIHVDPSAPFNKYSSTYVDDAWVPYLDYDGFRDGEFQSEAGWCIEQKHLMSWQRTHLEEIGFTESEIDDANYGYARMLLSRGYKEEFFAIYPQDESRLAASVSLRVTPQPDSVYRLWLYFVPVAKRLTGLAVPEVQKVVRGEFAVVELAYLTDREIPPGTPRPRLPSRRGKMLAHRAGT